MRKGQKNSLETRRKISKSNKGKTLSLEARRKLSEANKGEKNPNFGKHRSLEMRKKMSEANKGKKNPMYGRHLIVSLETRRKISEAKKGEKNYFFGKCFLGEKNPAWLGGKSFEPYGLAFNKKLKELIRARDNYRCQQCFRHESELFTKTGKKKKLIVHHIDYNKRNNKPSNFISLCLNCHSKTNFKRDDWTKYFTTVLNQALTG